MQRIPKILIILAVSIVLLLSVVLYFLSDGPDDETEQALDLESRIHKEMRDEMAESGQSPSDLRRIISRISAPTREALLAHYKLFYLYPENSRPLNQDMQDVIQPLRMQTSPVPVFNKKDPGENDSPYLTYEVTSPMHSIAGDQAFIAFLKVTGARGDGFAPEITYAKILSDSYTGKAVIAEPSFNDNGQEGDQKALDGVTTFRWQPPAKSRQYQGDLTLRLKFRVKGLDEELQHDLRFGSTPEAPAFFTGNFDEEIREGSLIISAEIDVKRSGWYVIEANLFHKSTGRPTHFSTYRGDLQPGAQRAELLFFGKLFYDKGGDGAYSMRSLRGTMQPRARKDINAPRGNRPVKAVPDPVEYRMPFYAGEYSTKAYELDQFSPAAYDGQDKQDSINNLESEAF